MISSSYLISVSRFASKFSRAAGILLLDLLLSRLEVVDLASDKLHLVDLGRDCRHKVSI